MDRKAVLKAQSRLRVARKAIDELSGCSDFETFGDTWYTFLVAAKNIYTVLEQGAKTTPQSRQWFGGKQEERRRDELLQYIYEARNDDEHGIEPLVEYDPGHFGIGVTREGYSNNVTFSGETDGHGNLRITELRSNDDLPVLVQHHSGRARLVTVRARGGRLYNPPSSHRGSHLADNSSINVAKIAIVYLDSLVEEAEKLA